MSDDIVRDVAAGPYVGLEPLRTPDRPYLKGREDDQRVVIANLRTASLTILYGAAGVGKSSLLLAGVVPQLQQDFPKTPVVVFRDWISADYPRRLARACIDATWRLGTDHPRPAEDRPLDEVLRACAEASRSTVLVLLDQFEDYLQYHPKSDAPESFEAQFARAVNREDVDVGFLVSVREASLSKLDRFRERIPQLLGNSLRLKHLDEAAARRAIGTSVLHEWNRRHPDEPAMRVEKAVVLQVIRDAQADLARGELGAQGAARTVGLIEAPFLQLVMARLWKAERLASSRVLRLSTLMDNDKLGGATHVVRSHLDEVMQGLSRHRKEVCATFFDRLVTPGGEKVPCNVGDLEVWAGALKGEVAGTLKQLSEGRILRTVPPDPRTPQQERYEIFHEVFAPSMLDWHRNFHEQRARDRAVGQVRQRARMRSLMLTVVSLTALVLVSWGWSAVYSRKSSADRKAYQSMAVGASDPPRALALALEAVDRIPLRIPGLSIVGLTGPTAATEDALRLAVQAARQESSLQHEHMVMGVALSKDGRLLVTREAHKAPPSRVTVWDLAPDGKARKQASQSFPDDPFLQGRVAFVPGPGGTTDTVAAVVGTNVGLWKFTDSAAPVVLPMGMQISTALAVSADGSLVAAAGRDFKDGVRRATIKVWRTTPPHALMTEIDPGGAWIMGLAFSPDGCCLATAAVERGSGQPTNAAVWSLASGRRILDLPMTQVSNTLAFSPDGKALVLGMRDNSVMLLRPKAGAKPNELGLDGILAARDQGRDVGEVNWNDRVLGGHSDTVRDVAFSDDSQRISSTSGDKKVIVWNAQTGEDLFTLVGHKQYVEAAAFGPEGQRLVSVGRDGTARIWNLGGHTGSIHALAFNPASERAQFATASSDRSAKLWDRSGDIPRVLRVLRGHTGDVYRLAYAPGGDRIATASFDRTVKLWDTASGALLGTLEGRGDQLRDLAFSADGKWLATANADGNARLHALRAESAEVVIVGRSPKQMLAVAIDPNPNPDLQRLRWVTAGEDGVIRLWDDQGTPLGSIPVHLTYPRMREVLRLIFLPRRGELAALIGGSVYFWPVARLQRDDGQAPRRLTVDDGRCDWMDLSRDETQLAVGCRDGAVRVYDLKADGSEPAKTLDLHREAVNGVAFSPDGRLLGSASQDGTFQVSPLDFEALFELAERRSKAMGNRRE